MSHRHVLRTPVTIEKVVKHLTEILSCDQCHVLKQTAALKILAEGSGYVSRHMNVNIRFPERALPDHKLHELAGKAQHALPAAIDVTPLDGNGKNSDAAPSVPSDPASPR